MTLHFRDIFLCSRHFCTMKRARPSGARGGSRGGRGGSKPVGRLEASPSGGKPTRKPAEKLVWEKGDEDEDITSESDVDEGEDSDVSGGPGARAGGEDEEEPETADQKRVRLAKEYIRRVRGDVKERGAEDEDGSGEEDDGTHGAVASRLADDVLASRGDLQLAVAKQVAKVAFTSADVTAYRGHQVGGPE